MEDTGNVKKSEIDRRIAEYQKTALHDYKKGEFVKTAVKVCDCPCGAVEHMWIRIFSVHKETSHIVGSLVNDPTHPSGFAKYGDVHVVSFDKIQEYIPLN